MKITNYQKLSNVTTLPDLIKGASIDCDAFIGAINGNLDLVDNCSTAVVSVNFIKAATTYPFSHNLGRIPQGFINIGMSTGTVIFQGSQANTINQIFLQGSGTGSGKVLVF